MAEQIDIWVVHPLKLIYRNSTFPKPARQKIELVSAKNEYESMQTALRCSEDFTIHSVAFSDLSAEDSIIESSNMSSQFVQYEEREQAKENLITPYTEGLRLYPESITPDPLLCRESIDVRADMTQGIFITCYVPSESKPGLYKGQIIISTSKGELSLPIENQVCNVCIPPICEAKLINYHWMMTNGFSSDGIIYKGTGTKAYDTGKYYYGIETYSQEWYLLMERFASVLTTYRTNMTWIRTDLFLQAGGTDLSAFTQGIPTETDWSYFDRYADIFIGKGIRHFANIHLYHMLHKIIETEDIHWDWKAGVPDWLPVIDDFLKNYLSALYQHLKDKKWDQEHGFYWYQHIKDEPIYKEHKHFWIYAAKKITEINKETGSCFILMDADPDGLLLEEDSLHYVDIMVPYTKGYHYRKQEFQAARDRGKGLWTYTMEVNRPPWLNRFWTQPIIAGRLLYWNLFQEGITGHLHWAWNAWYRGPWDGDTYLVYPDPEHKTVKSSLRHEAMRDGIEEYELLSILYVKQPELAMKLVAQAIHKENPTHYILDPDDQKVLHDYLVKAAAGMETGELPLMRSPYKEYPLQEALYIDACASEIIYNGRWRLRSWPGAGLGLVKSSAQTGDYLEFEFYGTGLEVVMEKGKEMGSADIIIDGCPATTISAFEGVPHDHFTVYNNHHLGNGKHKVRIINREDKMLHFDCFRIYGEKEQLNKCKKGLRNITCKEIPSLNFHQDISCYSLLVSQPAEELHLLPEPDDKNSRLLINGHQTKEGKEVTVLSGYGKGKILISCMEGDRIEKEYDLRIINGVTGTTGENLARRCCRITADAVRPAEEGVKYGTGNMIDGKDDTMFASILRYENQLPLPHDLTFLWHEPQDFNLLLFGTKAGLLQGIAGIEVLVSVEEQIWKSAGDYVLDWKHERVDDILEWVAVDLADMKDVKGLKIRIYDAYNQWSMYAVYALEILKIPDNGMLRIKKD